MKNTTKHLEKKKKLNLYKTTRKYTDMVSGVISFELLSLLPWQHSKTFAVLSYGEMCYDSTKSLFIKELSVATEFRRQGFATELINTAKEIGRAHGYTLMTVHPMSYCSMLLSPEYREDKPSWKYISFDELVIFYSKCGFLFEELDLGCGHVGLWL